MAPLLCAIRSCERAAALRDGYNRIILKKTRTKFVCCAYAFRSVRQHTTRERGAHVLCAVTSTSFLRIIIILKIKTQGNGVQGARESSDKALCLGGGRWLRAHTCRVHTCCTGCTSAARLRCHRTGTHEQLQCQGMLLQGRSPSVRVIRKCDSTSGTF